MKKQLKKTYTESQSFIQMIETDSQSVNLTKFDLFSVTSFLLLGLLLIGNASIEAAELYKWVDAEGNVTYQDEPPPSSADFEEQIVIDGPDDEDENTSIDQEIEEAARKNPVSLYTTPECDACDLVRLYLTNNRIPFAEKNVEDNFVMQQELKEKSGRITVPTLIVGESIMDGYSRSALKQTFVDNGFPVDEIAALDQVSDSDQGSEGSGDGVEEEGSENFSEDGSSDDEFSEESSSEDDFSDYLDEESEGFEEGEAIIEIESI